MANRTRKRNRAPRVVMLDTRQVVNLDRLADNLAELACRLNDTMELISSLGAATRTLIPIVSELHAAQQKRSAAASKAAATRKATANGPAPDPDAGGIDLSNPGDHRGPGGGT